MDSSTIAEIMDTIEQDGGPKQWTFDTRGRVTLTPAGLADLIAWAAKRGDKTTDIVARLIA